MINIRPVSDLRNKFSEIEEEVITTNSPIFLTKNGYGTMVVMSIEQYSSLTDSVERRLDEADKYADECKVRHSKEEVFKRVRERINGK
jgi:prevent-host-death family protein